MEKKSYGGWKNNIRLSNGRIELIVTQDIGPRVIRLGFKGKKNLFCEFRDQLGKKGEKDWQIRGGHRLWIAPEVKPMTYDLDNGPVDIRPIRDGIKTVEKTGKLSGCRKVMKITMSKKKNEVTVVHELTNMGRRKIRLAPWALTVMAPGGMAIVPMPEKISHTKQLLHNQEWSIWGYTDFADGRWTIGSRYLFFRQDRRKGPAKLGVAHREGWVGYVLGPYLFVKKFERIEGACYPDGGVNFETFSNEDFLEVETLGPLVDLFPGRTVRHTEKWLLFDNVPYIKTEKDALKYIRPLIGKN